jgi:hypothetical protein
MTSARFKTDVVSENRKLAQNSLGMASWSRTCGHLISRHIGGKRVVARTQWLECRRAKEEEHPLDNFPGGRHDDRKYPRSEL